MEISQEKILNLETFLLNSKSIIYFSIDFEGNLLLCNEGYKSLLGYSEKNIKDNLINPLFQSLMIDSKDGLVFSGVITLKNKHLNSSFVAQVYKLSDELFFLCEYDGLELETLFKKMSSNSLLINNMNRELIKKEILLKNSISQLKELQAMLIHSEKMNAVGQLVAGIAHEINNPMAYVLANVEIMGQYFGSIKEFFADFEEEKKVMDMQNLKERHDINYILEDYSDLQKATLEGGERIKKIVSELRDYSRIDASEKNISNISECIMNSLNIAEPEIKRNAINLKLNFSETSDIECYPAQLNQVFLNIIINAVQAAGEKGNVSISLHEQKNFIIVKIEDNGPGICEEHKCKIFEPFFTTKPPGKGVGLGLNLSYKIIKDMHKGEINFDTRPGNGTIFTIFIPKGTSVA